VTWTVQRLQKRHYPSSAGYPADETEPGGGCRKTETGEAESGGLFAGKEGAVCRAGVAIRQRICYSRDCWEIRS
jgi:hypothetical protein